MIIDILSMTILYIYCIIGYLEEDFLMMIRAYVIMSFLEYFYSLYWYHPKYCEPTSLAYNYNQA